MEALIARLSPALDLDSLLDDPAMPIDAGESKPDSPTASTPSSRSRMPDVIPPPTIFLPGSSRHPASNDATTSADTHAPCMQAANGSRLRQASVDYDSLEDDTLFIGSKLAATTLDCGDAPNTHPASPAHVASQPERLVEAVVRAPHADPPDNWSYKYIGRASTLHALQHIKRLSRRSFQELGVHPQQVRPQYWTDQNHIPQAASLPKSCANAWPAPDLASILLDAYFARLNRDFPIVNESQFRHQYALSHHTSSDNGWLALAYCIFMVGSLYVDDERARADPENEHSRGMQWWQVAKELILDRELASSLGRPLMLQDEDLDVELPLLVDDEGLLLRAKASLLPHQSTAEPALIGGFLCSLQLDKIIGLIHKTTYALNKPKSRPGSTSIESDRRKAEQLDSLLNAWLQSVPSHLTYDPEESTDEWLIQSTLLHCKYYKVASRDMIDHQGGGHDTAQGSSQAQTFADVWCIAGPSATSRPDETGDATTAVNVQDASIPDADVQDGASDRQPVTGPPTFDEYAFGYFQPWPEAAPADCDDFLRQEWSEMEVLDGVVRSVDRPREQSLHMVDDFLDWLQRLH
ncbi:hypothetical protein L1887_62763 [Cichorium endivia]|nr:hypothetical protein L1887_62763 [Cichorium endivia]